jgi:hypothetical protein
VNKTLTGAELRERIEVLLRANGVSETDVDELLTAGYGYALSLDSQRLRMERRITELAERAEEPDAANELRQLWLRLRTIGSELTELRKLLRQLRESQPTSAR